MSLDFDPQLKVQALAPAWASQTWHRARVLAALTSAAGQDSLA